MNKLTTLLGLILLSSVGTGFAMEKGPTKAKMDEVYQQDSSKMSLYMKLIALTSDTGYNMSEIEAGKKVAEEEIESIQAMVNDIELNHNFSELNKARWKKALHDIADAKYFILMARSGLKK